MVIPGVLILAGLYYYLIRKPERLLLAYLFALPLFPPLPIGPIEISVLDLLTIPAMIYLIYHLGQNGFKISGYFTSGFLLFVTVAAISFISFSIQQMTFSAILFMKLFRLIEMLLPVLLAVLIAARMRIDRIILFFLVGGGLAALAGIIMYLAGYSYKPSQTFASLGEFIFRAAGTHGDSGSFGNLMGLVSLVGIWTLIYGKEISGTFSRRAQIFLAWSAMILSTGALTLSLSRGGIVLLAIGLVVILAPLTRNPRRLLKVIFISAMIILLAVGLFGTFVENDLILKAVNMLGERLNSFSDLTTDFETVSSRRTIFWEKSWLLWSGNIMAWPFGLGYKSLDNFYDSLPDNNFFQALFEMGLVGVMALIFLIYGGFRAGIDRFRHNRPSGILVLAIWIGIISNMFSADVLTYWHNIPPIFIILVVFTHEFSTAN
nr:O-antigen ligase family protein [candidate division Zixibacteria bacterium]